MWYGLYVSLSFFSPSPCLLTVPGNLGCFKDSGDPPTLSGTSETSNKLTIQNCISFCRKQRYKVGRFFSNVSRVYFIILRKFDCLPLTGGKSLQSITRVMSEMDTSCPSWCSSFYVNHLHLQAISWQLLSWCPAQSMPSLFSHQASCFKPTSGWQIIVAIKADSWKWMVISPVGTSSSMHFAHLWVWHAIVPATNSARCSFSVSADPVQLRLHWQTLTAPPPSPRISADVTGCGGRLASSAYPWTVAVLNAHVKTSVLGSTDPMWLFDKEHAWWVRQQSIACLLRQKNSCWCSSDRIMQQGRSSIHLGASGGLINSYSMREDAEWEMMQYLQLSEFI